MASADPRLHWQRTSPLAVVFFITRFARQFVMNALPAMVLLLGLAAASDLQWPSILTGVLVVVAVGVSASVLSYLRFRFCITDDAVLVRSGVVHREELIVEFDRIQNITIKEPFYMRPFGLALLSIDTAGSVKKEITLGGIAKPLALTLRNTILSGEQPLTTDDIEEPVFATEPTLLLARSRRDIVIYGLTVNFFLWVVVAFGAVFSTEISQTFLHRLASRFKLDVLLTTAQSDDSAVVGMLVIIGLILAALLLLPLISVIGALLRHYGYRLTVDAETYRKNSGLLSRHDESMKRHKIQAVVWKQNSVARWFGRINIQLRVASAGSGMDSAQLQIGSKSTFLVPALHPAEAIDLTAEFLPGCQSDQVAFSSVDRRRYTLKTLSWDWLPFILGACILPTILVSWKIALAVPLAMGFAWLIVHQCWRKLGWGVVGEYGFVRTGFIGTMITVFPLFKVQRIDIRQTPFQHRAGLANLTIHLASHSLTVPYMRMQDAGRFRNLALYYVESTDRPWY